MPPVRATRQRGWCFTYNIDSWENQKDIVEDKFKFEQETMVTMAWQVERAPTTGHVHIQGYVEFTNARSMSGVKSLFFPSIHVEGRRGTCYEAYKYCVDEAKRAADLRAEAYVGGLVPSAAAPGRRTDLDAVREAVDNGDSMLSVAENHFGTFVRYGRGIREYQLMRRAANQAFAERTKKTVVVYWGPTGSGKSRHIDELWPDAFRVQPGSYGNVWFTGYDGQPVTYFEDFYSWVKLDFLLRLLDWYPVSVPSHGGMLPFVSTTIVFSSNYDPKDWYPNVGRTVKEALLRRLEFVFKVDYSLEYPCVACGTFPHQENCRYVASSASVNAGQGDWVSPNLRQRS